MSTARSSLTRRSADAADATDTVTVIGTSDLRFDPDEFTVAAGGRVSVELTNEGVEHDFVLEDVADVAQVHETMDDHDMDMDTPEEDLEVVDTTRWTGSRAPGPVWGSDDLPDRPPSARIPLDQPLAQAHSRPGLRADPPS